MAKLPNSNISVELVRGTLGASGNNVGTLCTHPNVNMWSKWKPVNTKVQALTEDVLKETNCGLICPEIHISNIGTAGAGWTYDKPGAEKESLFRLGDFRNYEHSAVKVSIMDDLPDLFKKKGDNGTLTITFSVPEMPEGNIQLSDLQLWNYYAGAQFKSVTGEKYITVTSPKRLTDGGINIKVDFTGFYEEEFEVRFFFSPDEIKQTNENTPAVVIAFPSNNIRSMKLETEMELPYMSYAMQQVKQNGGVYTMSEDIYNGGFYSRELTGSWKKKEGKSAYYDVTGSSGLRLTPTAASLKADFNEWYLLLWINIVHTVSEKYPTKIFSVPDVNGDIWIFGLIKAGSNLNFCYYKEKDGLESGKQILFEGKINQDRIIALMKLEDRVRFIIDTDFMHDTEPNEIGLRINTGVLTMGEGSFKLHFAGIQYGGY